MAKAATPPPPREVRVWDVPTRLFHWSLVALVAISVATGLAGDPGLLRWHMLSGQAILALLLFRVVWGLAGSPRSRFTDFLAGPRAILDYLRGAPPGTPGHNPAGGWSVMAMLALLSFQAATGLFANDDIMTEGPLAVRVAKETSDLLTSWHHRASLGLYLLVGLHLAAIVFYLRVKGENLVRPMLTGRRPLDGRPWQDRPFAPVWLAGVLLGLCGLAVYGLVSL